MSELRDRLSSVEAEISELRGIHLVPLYNERDQILAKLAEDETYKLPRPSQRTDKQTMISRCPRCRERIE